uniref:Uncharacterized protein n=1 Tax=viral metagenome TaxID=1070528 RepID=A0A6C0BDL3_9ZZZZ
MLHIAKSGIDLNFQQNPRAGSACISVGFSVKGLNWFVLNKLLTGVPCSCPSLSYGSEITSVCYAICVAVNTKLQSNPKFSNLNKVFTTATCNIQNDMFFINVNTQHNFNAIKRVIGVIFGAMKQSESHYREYATCLSTLNSKPSRDHFNYAVDVVRSGLAKLYVLIIAKLPSSVDKAKLGILMDMMVASHAQFSHEKLKPSAEPESMKTHVNPTQCPNVKAGGIYTFLLMLFLRSKLPGMRVSANTDEVIVYTDTFNHKHMDKAVSTWCKRLVNVPDLHVAFATMGLNSGQADPCTLVDLLNEGDKFTVKHLESQLIKLLK